MQDTVRLVTGSDLCIRARHAQSRIVFAEGVPLHVTYTVIFYTVDCDELKEEYFKKTHERT